MFLKKQFRRYIVIYAFPVGLVSVYFRCLVLVACVTHQSERLVELIPRFLSIIHGPIVGMVPKNISICYTKVRFDQVLLFWAKIDNFIIFRQPNAFLVPASFLRGQRCFGL